VAFKALDAHPNWVSVSDVFDKSDAVVLKSAGVSGFDDPRYEKYQARLNRLRAVKDYKYVVHVLERGHEL